MVNMTLLPGPILADHNALNAGVTRVGSGSLEAVALAASDLGIR